MINARGISVVSQLSEELLGPVHVLEAEQATSPLEPLEQSGSRQNAQIPFKVCCKGPDQNLKGI